MSPYSAIETARQEFHFPIGRGWHVNQKILE